MGVEGSATSSLGEYEFKALSSIETEVIVVMHNSFKTFSRPSVVIGQ